jgi:methyltransferase (TIGR00027 family)
VVRTDDDSWDLASSVGATATMVAAARAIASRAEHPLIDDPFAEPLVRAVGVDLLARLAAGDVTPSDLGADTERGLQRMVDNMAVRTMFFDDFFLDAAEAGVRQAVILASGLDSRAYRLPWPAGTMVFEIDQPDVIAFKSRTLAELGARPSAGRRAVAVDLRDDWPTALKEAGFDPALPTAWSAEGLLGYLPPDAQDRLLDAITALSAPGSRFATESAPTLAEADHDVMREQMQKSADQWREHGFDLDLAELIYLGDRNEAEAYLTDHGWQLTGSTILELFDAHGLPPFENDEMVGYANIRYVAGTLGAAR